MGLRLLMFECSMLPEGRPLIEAHATLVAGVRLYGRMGDVVR